jgi:glycerol kinase
MSALGAALLAGLGAGVWGSKEEIRRLQRVQRTYVPNMEEHLAARHFVHWTRAIDRACYWVQENDCEEQ